VKGSVIMEIMDMLNKHDELKIKATDLEIRANKTGWTPTMVCEARDILKEVNDLEVVIHKYMNKYNIN
jgi:hypothetical protein